MPANNDNSISRHPLRYHRGRTNKASEKKRRRGKYRRQNCSAGFFEGRAPRSWGRSCRVPDLPACLRPGRGANGALPCARRRGWRGGGRQLRAHHVTGTGSHREEAAGPLSPWKQGALRRFLRLQPALPVLPERFHRLRRRARRALARNRTGRVGGCGRIACDRRQHRARLHLQRAARGPRVRPRHRAPRPRAWPGQRAGIQRLRERRPAARGGTVHRCREHRPEGLHPELLRPRRR